MSAPGSDTFADGRPLRTAPDEAEAVLTIELGGFEGPLDLLLELARRQKVDLSGLSMLALAEQYLGFITRLKALRIELAADYLVMAAWLTYLKSRLLLPREEADQEEPDAEALADLLAARLRRLDAVRGAAAWLEARPRLGRERWPRGQDMASATGPAVLVGDWQGLVSAYAALLERRAGSPVRIARPDHCTLAEAREALEHALRIHPAGVALAAVIGGPLLRARPARSALASAFASALELAREGHVALDQGAAFSPLRVKPLGRARGAA